MEDIFNIDYTWLDLLFLIGVLVLINFLLHMGRRVVSNMALSSQTRGIIKRCLDIAISLYEPLTALIILAVFVMIRPGMHGIMVLIMGIAGFDHVRNYLHSRVAALDRSLSVGKQIKTGVHEGIIADVGRLGLKVRGDDGLHHIPYHRMVKDGFVLSSGGKIGGYYHLHIRSSHEHPIEDVERLSDLLLSSPYVDADHKPEISQTLTAEGMIDARILVKEETHVHDLIAMLGENGYDALITHS